MKNLKESACFLELFSQKMLDIPMVMGVLREAASFLRIFPGKTLDFKLLF